MRKDELLAELKKIENKRKELFDDISKLNESERTFRSELAAIATGLVVGDIVTYDGAKSAWRLSRMHHHSDTWIDFYGFKLKKDGAPSLKEERIYEDGRKLQKVAR